MLQEPLQLEIEKLKRQKNIMLIGIGALSLSTIIAIILWLLGINLNPKPLYESPIDITKFKLADSVAKFRRDMAPSTKTYLIMYNESSILSYHQQKFSSIISSSGVPPLSNANYSWQTVYYPMVNNGKMSLAIIPTIVEKDISGSNIIKVFDYFDPANFSNPNLYNSKALTAYDFGHLEP